MITFLKNKLGLNLRLAGIIPYLIGAIFFVVLPTILLILKAAEPNSSIDRSALWGDQYMWKLMWRSIWLALLAALISLIIIFPFIYFVTKSESKALKLILIVLIMSPLFVFTISKVFALKGILLAIFDNESMQSNPIKIIGMVYLYSPFMVVPLYSVLNQMPKSLIEASTDLGYSKFKTIFRVVFPYCLKAIFAGIALVFMLSATNLVISNNLLVGGSTAPKLIGNLIDEHASRFNTGRDINDIKASTIAIITILVMSTVYGLISFAPKIYRKIKGGVDA